MSDKKTYEEMLQEIIDYTNPKKFWWTKVCIILDYGFMSWLFNDENDDKYEVLVFIRDLEVRKKVFGEEIVDKTSIIFKWKKMREAESAIMSWMESRQSQLKYMREFLQSKKEKWE